MYAYVLILFSHLKVGLYPKPTFLGFDPTSVSFDFGIDAVNLSRPHIHRITALLFEHVIISFITLSFRAQFAKKFQNYDQTAFWLASW